MKGGTSSLPATGSNGNTATSCKKRNSPRLQTRGTLGCSSRDLSLPSHFSHRPEGLRLLVLLGLGIPGAAWIEFQGMLESGCFCT